jgi:hypothetical protein
MPDTPSPVTRQRRLLFPLLEPSASMPAEQRRELRLAMTDLLLGALNGGSSSTQTHDERSTKDESKADR